MMTREEIKDEIVEILWEKSSTGTSKLSNGDLADYIISLFNIHWE